MTTTTLTRKYPITLPAEIVQALELTPGSQVEWAIGPDAMTAENFSPEDET
jgi:bifunctional DNA-binding transcriptional regulator/antitoxin component of YhaV-PrlF toxin-antitoxin module